MTNTTGKQEALRQLHQEWEIFLAVARSLSMEEYLLPGVAGPWSTRDLVLHIAAWDAELITIVDKHRRTGEESDYGTDEEVDQLNEAQVEENRGLSVEELWEHVHDTHQRLVDFLTSLPEEAFTPDSYTGDWLAGDSFSHYRDHRKDLERWKASR